MSDPSKRDFNKWWWSITDAQLEEMTPTEKAWAAYQEGYKQARADRVKEIMLDAIEHCEAREAGTYYLRRGRR